MVDFKIMSMILQCIVQHAPKRAGPATGGTDVYIAG